MPCMNSTSALDIGGRLACVSLGRAFVGSPGAPGCTTAGPPLALCDTPVPGAMQSTALASISPRAHARAAVLHACLGNFPAGKPLISVLLRYHACQAMGQSRLLLFTAQSAQFLTAGDISRRFDNVLWCSFLLFWLPMRDAPPTRSRLWLFQCGLRRVLTDLTHKPESPPQGGLFVAAIPESPSPPVRFAALRPELIQKSEVTLLASFVGAKHER